MGNKDKYSHLSKRKPVPHNHARDDSIPQMPSTDAPVQSRVTSQQQQPADINGKYKKRKHAQPAQSFEAPFQMPTDASLILQYLLGGSVSVDEFMTKYWQQKPLHIKRGNRDFCSHMYNKAIFDKWLLENQTALQYGVNLNVFVYDNETKNKVDLNPVMYDNGEQTGSDADSSEQVSDDEGEDGSDEGDFVSDDNSVADTQTYAEVDASYVQSLFNDRRASIQHIQPQQYQNTHLYQLMTLMETYFGSLVGCNAYLTPGNAAQGLAPHHDDVELFVLQAEGSKTWSMFKPNEQQTLAYEHSGDLDESQLTPLMTVNMQAGDMLYMPRGIIHRAVTSDTTSVHLTLSTYQQHTYYDLMHTALNNALIHARDNNVLFRQGLPLQFASFMGTGAQLAADIAEQTQIGSETELSEQADKQQIVSDQFESLLTQLSEYIDLHSAADDMVDDFVQSRLPPYKQQTIATIDSDTVDNGATRTYCSMPNGGDCMIKLVDVNTVRMTVGNIDNDVEDTAGDDHQYVYLSFSTQNSISQHMSSLTTPKRDKRIRLPLEVAPALITLYTTATKYIRVSELPLPDECDMSAVQLAVTLWSVGVVECKDT